MTPPAVPDKSRAERPDFDIGDDEDDGYRSVRCPHCGDRVVVRVDELDEAEPREDADAEPEFDHDEYAAARERQRAEAGERPRS